LQGVLDGFGQARPTSLPMVRIAITEAEQVAVHGLVPQATFAANSGSNVRGRGWSVLSLVWYGFWAFGLGRNRCLCALVLLETI
jgi:hypothetical protein